MNEIESSVFNIMLEKEKSCSFSRSLELHDFGSAARRRIVLGIFCAGKQVELSGESMFLAVQLMDKYLSSTIGFGETDLKEIGALCLVIAAKQEDKSMQFFVNDIFLSYKPLNYMVPAFWNSMEILILNTVNWEIYMPTPFYFLNYFSSKSLIPSYIRLLAKSYMESTVATYECLSLRPSLIAASCLFLANRNLSNSDASSAEDFSDTLGRFGYDMDTILNAISVIEELAL